MIRNGELCDVATMQRFYRVEQSVKAMHGLVFRGGEVGEEDLQRLHGVCWARLGAAAKGVAIRVELFALLYLCEPYALFCTYSQYSPAVKDYAGRVIGISGCRLSRYKRNLVFLYFNDNVFRAAVDDVLSAVTDGQDA